MPIWSVNTASTPPTFFASTYTNKAVGERKQRLLALIGEEMLKNGNGWKYALNAAFSDDVFRSRDRAILVAFEGLEKATDDQELKTVESD